MNLSSPLNSIIGQTPDSRCSSLIFAIPFYSGSEMALGLLGGGVGDGDGDGNRDRDREVCKTRLIV